MKTQELKQLLKKKIDKLLEKEEIQFLPDEENQTERIKLDKIMFARDRMEYYDSDGLRKIRWEPMIYLDFKHEPALYGDDATEILEYMLRKSDDIVEEYLTT